MAESQNFNVNMTMPDFRDALADAVQSQLDDLLEGAEADVRQFAVAIANDLTRAASQGDSEMVAALSEQMQLLGEINRVRAVNEAWDTVGAVIRVAGVFAIRMVASASAVA